MRQKNKLLLLYADHVFQSATNLLSENSPNSEFFGPCFPAFGLITEVSPRKNTDQKNSEYGHFSRTNCIITK